jgi:hypothetical protein
LSPRAAAAWLAMSEGDKHRWLHVHFPQWPMAQMEISSLDSDALASLVSVTLDAPIKIKVALPVSDEEVEMAFDILPAFVNPCTKEEMRAALQAIVDLRMRLA